MLLELKYENLIKETPKSIMFVSFFLLKMNINYNEGEIENFGKISFSIYKSHCDSSTFYFNVNLLKFQLKMKKKDLTFRK